MTSKIIQQGAEALILLSPDKKTITKKRIKKSYRISELDEKIRKLRTRSETKLLEKASEVILIPDVIKSDEREKEINMEFIDGKKLSNHLNNFLLKKQLKICKQIGENIANLHNANIIHGDLTTSNIILVEKEKNLPTHSHSQIDQNSINKKSSSLLVNKQIITSKASSKIRAVGENAEDKTKLTSSKIFIIDFGLGFRSHKFEDKAVDIHLLKQALEAKHFKNWEILFKEMIKGYKKAKDHKIIIERLKAVEKRRRYRH